MVDRGFYWMGYAAAMLFGLYDSRRKALNLYSQAVYPHPLVRRQLFSDFTATYIRDHRPDLVDTWRTRERAGWSACVSALRYIDVEALAGRFGGSAKESYRYAPVSALTYNVFDSTYMRGYADEEIERADSIFRLIGA
jgi:hypothetical protein